MIRFLQQAALDPEYAGDRADAVRTSKDSPMVDALCEAARTANATHRAGGAEGALRRGRQHRQSRQLERAGAHVVYRFMHLKTHAKMSTVVRRGTVW